MGQDFEHLNLFEQEGFLNWVDIFLNTWVFPGVLQWHFLGFLMVLPKNVPYGFYFYGLSVLFVFLLSLFFGGTFF